MGEIYKFKIRHKESGDICFIGATSKEALEDTLNEDWEIVEDE